MSKILAQYRNGNYRTTLYDDGTKIRENDLDNLIASRPESIDCQISNYCTEGCSFCYADCGPEGQIAHLNAPFFDTMLPGMEMAININRPIPKETLTNFLVRMQRKSVIVNATINQTLFEEEYEFIHELQHWELLRGIGISMARPSVKFAELLNSTKNAVVHVVAGIISRWDLVDLVHSGANSPKILILGYKTKGRGVGYREQHDRMIEERIILLKDSIPKIRNMFTAIAFDNLALEQLSIRSMIANDVWKESFLGDEGFATFYVNAVDQKFARSSLETEMFDIGDKSIQDMFDFIKQHYGC